MRKAVAYLIVFALAAMVLATVPMSTSAGYVGDVTILKNGKVDPANAPIYVSGSIYTMTDDITGTITIEKSGITLDGAGFTVGGSGTGNGIYLEDVNGVTLMNLNIHGFLDGIMMISSNHNTIKQNTVSQCVDDCIDLKGSDGNTIKENMITNSGQVNIGDTTDELYANGIFLEDCDDNTIKENTVSYIIDDAIYLIYSSDNTVKTNIVTDSTWGIVAEMSSHNNIIKENTVTDMSSNSIVVALNCFNNNICHNVVSNAVWGGIAVASNANNNMVKENTLYNTRIGVMVFMSSGNCIWANSVSGCIWEGIRLQFSNGNTIKGNTLEHNYRGILLIRNPAGGSNLIKENSIRENDVGMILSYNSYDNVVYHNNFVANGNQAIDNGIGNCWDNGAEGNYWSDYSGMDMDDDGIGDTPYYINGVAGSADNYPLMNPW
ncbi:MAG: right-handed parallel beta-helix repeat-containing protein [Thermoplasmata archaeon]|nr:MAG: right-handed parallel beta-helix repeat-containing protein [Thermoplasmata archaeon]